MNNLEIMWTFSWTEGLIHNPVSIILNHYNVYNLQNFEDNLDYFWLESPNSNFVSNFSRRLLSYFSS